jgi:hypothetical protein
MADHSAVLVEPNGKGKMEALTFHPPSPPPSLHELLRESFTDVSKNPKYEISGISVR